MSDVTITVELTHDQAAALRRFCDKSGHAEAMAVLYRHVPKAVREDQAYVILDALRVIERALEDAGVASFPWIETGQAR